MKGIKGWKLISDVSKKELNEAESKEFKTLISDDTVLRGFSGTGKTWTAIAKALYTSKIYKDEIPIFIVDTENALNKVQFNANWCMSIANAIGLDTRSDTKPTNLEELCSQVGSKLYILNLNERVGSEKIYDTTLDMLKSIRDLPNDIKALGYKYGILIIDSLTDLYKMVTLAIIQNRLDGNINEIEMLMDNIAQIQDWNKVSNLMYDSIVTLTMNRKILVITTMKEKESQKGEPVLQGYKDMPYYAATYIRCFVGEGLVGGRIAKKRKYEIRKTWGLTGDTWPVIDANFMKLINIILGKTKV